MKKIHLNSAGIDLLPGTVHFPIPTFPEGGAASAGSWRRGRTEANSLGGLPEKTRGPAGRSTSCVKKNRIRKDRGTGRFFEKSRIAPLNFDLGTDGHPKNLHPRLT